LGDAESISITVGGYYMKKFGLMVIAVAMLFALTGVAMADPGINQTPETQGIVTSTAVQALGTVTETDSVVWQTAYADLTIPPLNPEEVAYTMSYTESTIADQGLVSYVKGQSLDTANKVAGTYNFNTQKLVDFIGLDTGRMITSENEVMDGALWLLEDGPDYLICPFAGPEGSFIPGFCNIVEMGSSADLTLASLTTTTDERHVAESGDRGVAMDYSVKITGFGDVPAMGSAEAYINAHIQEGNSPNPEVDEEGAISKAEDLVYSESTTASGDITLFQKVMQYDSKITGMMPLPPD
jgi:hypothetical protein